ncbi:MAG: hypothetical protein J3K34DRAFT_445470 [Monoraphidium minutum]|nr:MAG: hypothetical protein J3K34DRAFT_445470 [Monoraphidium minutum]
MAAEAVVRGLTAEDVPARSELPDGGALLAEADAYRVLEGGRLVRFGGLVAPQKLRLVRHKRAGRVAYALRIEPTEPGGSGGKPLEIELNARTRLTPARLSGLKHGKHVLKPAGESVASAALNSTGSDIELVVIEVTQKASNPLLALIGRSGAHAALGFDSPSEAKGWHLYLSAVLGVVDEADGRTFEAMCAKHSAAGHQAHTLGAMFDAMG